MIGFGLPYNRSLKCAQCEVGVDCVLPAHWPTMYCISFGAGEWVEDFVDGVGTVWVYETGHDRVVSVGACSPVTVPLATDAGGVASGSRPSGAIDNTLFGGSFSVRNSNLEPYFPDEGEGSETNGGLNLLEGSFNTGLGWTKEFFSEDGTPYLSVSISHDDNAFRLFYNVNLTTGEWQPWAGASQSVYFDLANFGGDGGGNNRPGGTIHNRAVGLEATIFQSCWGSGKSAYYLNTDQETRVHTSDNWIRDDDRQYSRWDHSDYDEYYVTFDEADRNLFATACLNSAPYVLTHNPWNGRVYRARWKNVVSNGHTSVYSTGEPWQIGNAELQAHLCTTSTGVKDIWCYTRKGGQEAFLCSTSDAALSATHYYSTATGFQPIHADDVAAERRPSFIHIGPDNEILYGSQSFLRRLGDRGWLRLGDADYYDTSFDVRKVFNISSNCGGYVVHGFGSTIPSEILERERYSVESVFGINYGLYGLQTGDPEDPGVPPVGDPLRDLEEPDTVEFYYGTDAQLDVPVKWHDWTISRDGQHAMPHRYCPDNTVYTSYDRTLVQVPTYSGLLQRASLDYDLSWIDAGQGLPWEGSHGAAGRPCVSWIGKGNLILEG